jgi:hypothetical protein
MPKMRAGIEWISLFEEGKDCFGMGYRIVFTDWTFMFHTMHD